MITIDGSEMDAVYEELDPALHDIISRHGKLTVLATMAAVLVGEFGAYGAIDLIEQIDAAEERE